MMILKDNYKEIKICHSWLLPHQHPLRFNRINIIVEQFDSAKF